MKKTEMRGGAFLNGKEGFCPLEGEPKGSKRLLKDDFRTKAQAPLADQNSGRAIAPPATSLALMVRARAWEWDKDPSSQEGDRGVEKSA